MKKNRIKMVPGSNSNLITNFKRFGRFLMSTPLIDRQPVELKQLFGKMIITRAELLTHSGNIEYIAICDDFELIKLGDPIPSYKWNFSRNHGWKCEKDPKYNRDTVGHKRHDELVSDIISICKDENINQWRMEIMDKINEYSGGGDDGK